MDGGNVNTILLCKMKSGGDDSKGLVVKQPLPYVKCVSCCCLAHTCTPNSTF